MFSVCPPAGCEASLEEEERLAFHELHADLVTAVRTHEPLKRDLSAHPLALQWWSQSLQQNRFAVVAFHVRKPPYDMVLLELDALGRSPGEDGRFPLQVQKIGGGHCLSLIRSDIDFCHELARAASDWVLYRLKLGDLSCDFSIFDVLERTELTRASLRQAEQEMRQILRATKAAKLAQGLAAAKKRKKRSKPKGSQKTKRPQALASDVSDEDWGNESSNSASDFGLGDEDAVLEAAASSRDAPASSSAAPVHSSGRRKQSRSIPWGPFQLAPIVPASGQSGWGAICGQHRDRGNNLSCKKAMNRGDLTDAECVLRLKRWLLAGCEDQSWPIHRQRSHHVEMGGKGLQDFAEGMSEEAMDALVASWT